MEHILQFIQTLPPILLLGTVLLLAILEYIFPPVPGDTTMLLASTLAGAHVLSPSLTLSVMIFGSILGGLLAYLLGLKAGRRILRSFLFKYLSQSQTDKAETIFSRHAAIVLIGNRFLPGVRGIMLPLAGIFDYPVRGTLFALVISNAAWCTLIFSIGIWFGGNMQAAERLFHSYNIILAVAFSLIILTRLWSSRRSSASS